MALVKKLQRSRGGKMITLTHRRWSDNDCYFGPFTYAKETTYRHFGMVLDSGDEDYPGASFRISGFGRTLILALPQWLVRPYKEKVYPKSWDFETIARLGRAWYWKIDRREYGFSIHEGHLSVHFGRQAMDSAVDQRWGCFLPWTQWRMVRHSFYGLNGEHVATLPDTGKSYRDDLGRWDRERKIKDSIPTRTFKFADFDGEKISAVTKIEEREWRFGTGWFKWLSWFCKPMISRFLDIKFSSEVGKRKGSWKGGTLGHGIELLPFETHESGFRRYCIENYLTFIEEGVE